MKIHGRFEHDGRHFEARRFHGGRTRRACAPLGFAGNIVPSELPYAVSEPKTQTKQLPAQATISQKISPYRADAVAGAVMSDPNSFAGRNGCHS